MIKKIFILLLLSNFLFAKYNHFSKNQIKMLNIAYSIGNIVIANDGMNFGKTLASILYQESSVRIDIIGDKYTNSNKLKPVRDSSLGAFQIKLSTAKEIIRTNELLYLNYKSLLKKENETILIDKLLGNIKFGALIAAHYLKTNYEYAKLKKKSKPYFRTVSRYNGGWKNHNYFKKIMKRMITINKFIKDGKIN